MLYKIEIVVRTNSFRNLALLWFFRAPHISTSKVYKKGIDFPYSVGAVFESLEEKFETFKLTFGECT
jgi:hypothetical protein